MQTRLTILLPLTFLVAPTGRSDGQPAAPAAAPISFAEVQGFAVEYCGKCHGEKVQKAGLNLAAIADERMLIKQRKAWRGVIQEITSGQMPPEVSKQPPKADKERVLKWLTATLDAADELDRTRPDPGPPVIRRLTPGEYNRTVRDLLGIDFDVAAAVGMPDETVGESFDNLAAALNFSDALTEKYFAAAELIIERLYALPPKVPRMNPGDPPPLVAKLINLKDPRASLALLAQRAYRRPIESREVDRLSALLEKGTNSGIPFGDALRPVFKAILVSPNFLLRIEHDRKKEEGAYRASDHELAVRLSYFLWSSMPDAELFALAERGELRRPEVFDAQIKRMLTDPKASALTETFAEQWLQLKRLTNARPSTEYFPTFNAKLRQAMRDEVTTFFNRLRTEDAPITDLLAADYSYLNADLAKHYGIEGVTGPEFRKVRLSDPNRGGLLGTGAVLTMTSHTSRTSPTLRGKYVLDVILGTPPPPPPPGAGQIDERKTPKTAKSFREKLALHASQSSCAGCHAKIDPLGFGLENFDAVGRWRPSGGDVIAAGKLPGGEAFDGPKELKGVLLARKSLFVENMTQKMFIFALGRELQPTDAPAVKAVTADLEKNGYKFSVLVAGVARSFPFQHRRNPREDD